MGRPKTYKINEEYFNQKMDERQAYLLGLVLSDGHINYERGAFQYICKYDDLEIVEFIKKELKSTHPIKKTISRTTILARYSITNKKLVQSLIDKFNLPHRNKSINNLSIPPNIPSDMIHHFLRGFFDGDGSIWVGGGTYRAAYTGGKNMMNSIKEITTKLGIPTYSNHRYSTENKNSCNLTINGTLNVFKFGQFLYANSTCYLKRKHKRFSECNVKAEYVKNRSLSMSGKEEKIKTLYLSGVNQKNISIQLNIGYSSVRCCVQRLRRNNEVSF